MLPTTASTPLTRLLIYCTSAFCKPQPATKRTEPFMFSLAPEGKKAACWKEAPAADKPPQNGCKAEGVVWEYSSGSVVPKHRRHWGSLTHEGYLGLRAFLQVNTLLQLPERTTFIVKSVLQRVKMMRWASMDLIKASSSSLLDSFIPYESTMWKCIQQSLWMIENGGVIWRRDLKYSVS